MNCDEVRDELDASALGALDDDEARAVAAHLAVCPECRRLAEEAAVAAHALLLALANGSPLTPPERLKARVLGAVTGAAVSAPVAQPREAGGLRTLTARQRWRWAAGAAAVLIVAVSVGWSVRLSSALDRERATRERIESFYSRQQELVLEVVDSPKTTKQILRPPTGESGAYGKLFTRPDLPDVVVMAARLPAPPDGQTYHLWLTSNGAAIDAGPLAVDDLGFGLVTLNADRPDPRYEAAEVRLQPAGTVVLTWSAAPANG